MTFDLKSALDSAKSIPTWLVVLCAMLSAYVMGYLQGQTTLWQIVQPMVLACVERLFRP